MKRDAKFIQSKIVVKDSTIYTSEKCCIEFPKWYMDKSLANFGTTTKIYGIFAIIIGDKYSVSIIPTQIVTKYVIFKEVDRDGEPYIQLWYNKGDAIVENTTLLQKDILCYNWFETLHMYAKVPWFLEYEDVVKIMNNTPMYSGSGVGVNPLANEIMVSFLTRYTKDKHEFHRHHLNDPYTYIDLMDVYYGVSTVTNKIAGNYFNDALTSALVQKDKTTTKLEQHAWK